MVKRGQLVVKALIVLVVSAVIILAFPYIGESYGSRNVYKKEIAAKEIALLIDTLYAYPYDIVVYYEKDLTGFIVEISENEVKVYDARFSNYDIDPTRKKYEFFPTGINEIKIKLENSKKIKFEKSQERLIIQKDEVNQ